jgi:hypothetical protein
MEIDSFIGKLSDVGLPTQTSIFVSSSGYTEGAIDRAAEVGMKTLTVVPGVSDDSPIHIQAALQSVVFMLCSYRQVSFKTDMPVEEGHHQYLAFYDSHGQLKATIPDVIWSHWVSGDPPLQCGLYRRTINIPDEWKHTISGQRSIAYDYEVDVAVEAVVLQFAGNVVSHTLLDASSGKMSHGLSEVQFDRTNPTGIVVVDSEEKLQELLSKREDVTINVGRIRIPRVMLGNNVLWPLSRQAGSLLHELEPELTDDAKLKRVAEVNLASLWDFSSFEAS